MLTRRPASSAVGYSPDDGAHLGRLRLEGKALDRQSRTIALCLLPPAGRRREDEGLLPCFVGTADRKEEEKASTFPSPRYGDLPAPLRAVIREAAAALRASCS